MRQLIVNADDFGFTRDVNAGIVEAHTNGILTATTLMANGDAYDDAVRLAREHPELDIGVHFVLIGGDSPLTGRPYPATVVELVSKVYSGALNLFDELAAQARRLAGDGLHISHADTHKHTHLLPPVRHAVCAVAEEFRIPFIRRFADAKLKYRSTLTRRIVSRLMRRAVPGLLADLESCGLRCTDHFAGFEITGAYDEKDLAGLFQQLPEGVTELMTHPGRYTSELRGASTRLKESREAELKALSHPATKAALAASSITLTRYRDL